MVCMVWLVWLVWLEYVMQAEYFEQTLAPAADIVCPNTLELGILYAAATLLHAFLLLFTCFFF